MIVERWLIGRLRHRTFYSLAEVNAAIGDLMAGLNDVRPIRRLGVTRRRLLEEVDRPALKPLPTEPYEYAEWKKCRVGVDYHVEVAFHYYSVPHRFLRAEVEARLTARTVEVFFQGERIAAHPRCAALTSTRRSPSTCRPVTAVMPAGRSSASAPTRSGSGQRLRRCASGSLSRYCDIVSDIDGVVTSRNVNPGNYVQTGQQLMAVRSLTEIWIDANFKETQLADLRIGQRVRCEIDMYGSRKEFEGRITGFTMGTGQTLALLPPQNATGNFVKIVQRLPVRIELTDYDPDKAPLFVGLSVTPYVYYKEPPTGPHAGEVLQPLATPPNRDQKSEVRDQKSEVRRC